MNTSTSPTAQELVKSIVDVLDEIRDTNGLPVATRESCAHSVRAIHESVHGLSLWLRELLEWAPLAPETRGRAVRLARELHEADQNFHPALEVA